jgi:hypothetical protein
MGLLVLHGLTDPAKHPRTLRDPASHIFLTLPKPEVFPPPARFFAQRQGHGHGHGHGG